MDAKERLTTKTTPSAVKSRLSCHNFHSGLRRHWISSRQRERRERMLAFLDWPSVRFPVRRGWHFALPFASSSKSCCLSCDQLPKWENVNDSLPLSLCVSFSAKGSSLLLLLFPVMRIKHHHHNPRVGDSSQRSLIFSGR